MLPSGVFAVMGTLLTGYPPSRVASVQLSPAYHVGGLTYSWWISPGVINNFVSNFHCP